MTDKPTVTQADRERLAKYYADGGANRLLCGRIRAGDLDSDPHLQMVAAHRIAAEQSRDDVIELLREIAREAASVMDAIEEHGGDIVMHLLDDDDNAGERLRKALRNLKGKKS